MSSPRRRPGSGSPARQRHRPPQTRTKVGQHRNLDLSLVAGLDRQLDPDPEPQPPIFEVARAAATHPGAIEATNRLRELLRADHVTRFTLADGGVLA
jgi:hypothetical protein